MKIAYLDCFSGISGDMFLGALLDCGLPRTVLRQKLSTLSLDPYTLSIKPVQKMNLTGCQITIRSRTRKHPHRGLKEIKSIISKSQLPEQVKELSFSVQPLGLTILSSIGFVPLPSPLVQDLPQQNTVLFPFLPRLLWPF